MIAPGNHWIYDSLRGAPLPGRSDFALRAGTPGTAFPTVFRKCANEPVGAILESPADADGIGKTAASRRRDVEGAVPYGFTKMSDKIRRGDH